MTGKTAIRPLNGSSLSPRVGRANASPQTSGSQSSLNEAIDDNSNGNVNSRKLNTG